MSSVTCCHIRVPVAVTGEAKGGYEPSGDGAGAASCMDGDAVPEGRWQSPVPGRRGGDGREIATAKLVPGQS